MRVTCPDASVRQRIEAVFAPFATSPRTVEIDLALALVDALPAWAPAGQIVSESRLLRCALSGDLLSAHFPRWGTVTVDLTSGEIRGHLLPAALEHYGAFDDMIIILLGPLLRRRGLFSIHAFAAARHDQAVLLVGDIGAGKTTTGLALLDAGWRLISNDSPLLSQVDSTVQANAYPGLLAAYDDTLARFPSLRGFMGDPQAPAVKRAFAAQEAFPDVWQLQAPARLLLFPRVSAGLRTSHVEPLSAADALLALVPNSIERWDRPYIPRHLAMLQALVQQAPAYRLCLAPDVPALPGLIEGLLGRRPAGATEFSSG